VTGLPNKNGATGVIQDMLRGDVQAAFLNVASTAGQVRAGKFRALAVVSHARLPEYPDVPTMQEVGFPEVGTHRLERAVRAGRDAEAGAGRALQDRDAGPAIARGAGKIQEADHERGTEQVAADATSWLDGEMKHWQTITTEVKIETPQ